MRHIFPKYKLQLIKESNALYEANNVISCPADIKDILVNVLELDKQAEEVFCILALNEKNKVIGTFEVARGSISQACVAQREVAKRLILLNAVKFISAHNHPSGDCEPSDSDIFVSNTLTQLGEIIGIKHLDFVILGNDILSLREKGGISC